MSAVFAELNLRSCATVMHRRQLVQLPHGLAVMLFVLEGTCQHQSFQDQISHTQTLPQAGLDLRSDSSRVT